MFVVFEGIDGSGKTTVSNLVAQRLRQDGIDIEHIREGGEFSSPLVGRMREFGKDTRNLKLRPLAEFLMYVARDAQLLHECIQPALAKGAVVFADRYLYSYEVLGHEGRGLQREQICPVLDSVADGVWPDLVVLMDVDPHLARARRRVSKIQAKAVSLGLPKLAKPVSVSGGGSRKGLGGVGMFHRIRDGYLRLASEDPQRWLVVDNSSTDMQDVVDQVCEAITKRYRSLHSPVVSARSTAATSVTASTHEPTVEAGADAFYKMIATRLETEPGVAAYFLSRLVGPRAHLWREKLADIVPHVVAHGLRGLGDERSWSLRYHLRSVSPKYVGKSISGSSVEGTQADDLRRELFAVVPLAVLSTLSGSDSSDAWEMRAAVLEAEPDAVLRSLRGLESEKAWQWRDRHMESVGQGVLDDPLTLRPLLESVAGLGDERSWAMREGGLKDSPIQVLKSLKGLECDRSWDWRQEFVEFAPKVVLRTFDSQESERAWAMRLQFGIQAKEVLESMTNSSSDFAWQLREELADVWPSTVAKSIGILAQSARATSLLEQLLSKHPRNLSLLKHATQISAMSEIGRTAGQVTNDLAAEAVTALG